MKKKTKICPQCGDSMSNGIHPKGTELVELDDFGFQQQIYAECSICKSKVNYNTLISQYADGQKWRRVFSRHAVFCPWCSHDLFPNK